MYQNSGKISRFYNAYDLFKHTYTKLEAARVQSCDYDWSFYKLLLF